MRFAILATVAAISSTALAQLSQIPACAQACFGANLGTCSTSDIACICGSSSIDKVSCCVFATCSPADIATTTNFAVTFCKLSNVNVNTAPICPSGSATPSVGNSTAAAATSSMSMSGSMSGSMSHSMTMSSMTGSMTGSMSKATSATAAASSAAAPYQTAGVGLGMAMAGLLAAL